MELPNRPTRDPYQEIPVKDFSYINTQKKPTKTGKHWGLIISGLVIFLLLAAGAYLYGQATRDNTKSHKTTSHKVTSTKKATASPSIPLTSYSSSTFNLSVDYPKTWLVSSLGNTSMSITSPATTLTADTGKSVDGKIIVNVYNQGQIPATFGSTSVAVLNSKDIDFTNPTTDQAAETYLSFVQYPATNIIGGLDAIYITGNVGYVKDQNIPSSDINQIDPLVIVSFEQCKSAACTSLSNLSISSSMWSKSSFSTPILDILRSFSFS